MGQTAVIQFTARLYTQECCSCGVAFAIPEFLDAELRKTKKSFYCPNGHPQSYSESDVDRLRKQLAAKEAELDRQKNATELQRREREAVERRLSAQFGINTKLRKRIGHGVCPCCQRTFKQLAAHMKTKHPEYATTDAEAQSADAPQA